MLRCKCFPTSLSLVFSSTMVSVHSVSQSQDKLLMVSLACAPQDRVTKELWKSSLSKHYFASFWKAGTLKRKYYLQTV
jgi:hypothetical protein